MQVTAFVLDAGQTARVALSGNYFRLLTSTAAVTVRLYLKSRPFSEAVGVLAGYWAKPDSGFEEVEIYSASAQTVYVGTIYGTGGYDRAQGDVNITGSSGAAQVRGEVGTIAVPTYTKDSLPVLTRDIGDKYGVAFGSTTNRAANTPENIIAAGSNVNGYLAMRLFQSTVVAGGGSVSFLAKATAPASLGDGDILAAGAVSAGGTTNPYSIAAKPLFVAAGKRLDSLTVVADASNKIVQALYTLL